MTLVKLYKSKEEAEVDFRLSVSAAKTFSDCAAKYKFSYILKLPRKEWDFHVFGSYLHAVLEYFHQFLLDDESANEDWLQTLNIAREKAIDEFKEKLTKQQIIDGDAIIQEYREIIQEEGVPNVTHVEKSFFIEIENKVLLRGFIDRVQVDPDGMLHVADYKTTKNPKYLKDFFQLETYCYAMMLEDESIERIRASFVLLRHGFDYMTQEYTRDEIMKVADKFLKYTDDIQSEKLWRPNPQFLCKYCDFVDEHCNDGQKYLIKNGMLKKKETFGIEGW